MTYSYIEENVSKLIVRYIFRNIPRFNCDTKKGVTHGDSIHCPHIFVASTLTTRPIILLDSCQAEQL
jgi:hypothetical protein